MEPKQTRIPTELRRGIYTLVIYLSGEAHLAVGKLNSRRFPKGNYTYTGSALGKGQASLENRVSRHLRREKQKRWHIDFLLAHDKATVTAVVCGQTNREAECQMNQYIMSQGKAEIPVMGFGASDCKKHCGSHLLYFGDAEIIPKIVELYREKMGAIFVSIYTPSN